MLEEIDTQKVVDFGKKALKEILRPLNFCSRARNTRIVFSFVI